MGERRRITARRLEHYDIIEFGETGPLSRFCLHGEDELIHKSVAGILGDGIAYLRVSRQPFASRVFRAFSELLRRLTRETTILFRITVTVAILALAALAYQQARLNTRLQQQIETSVAQLDSFAGALARAREEALTPGDLTALRQELGQRLSSNVERLAALERRSEASARVIAESMSSVVFLQGAYGFRERSSGRMLRHVVDN